MPVSKWRDVSELPKPSAKTTPLENLRSAFELSYLCLKLSRRPLVPGITRYRSIEAASKHKGWDSRLDQFRETQKRSGS